MRDGKLWASMDAGEGPADSVELRPIDANRFSIPGAPVVAEFVAPTDGRPRQIRVTGAGPKPFVSEQVIEGFAPTAAQLREYAGRYANADLDVTYDIVARGLRARDPDPRPRGDPPEASVPERVLRVAGRSDQVFRRGWTAGERLHDQPDQRSKSAVRARSVRLANIPQQQFRK